MNQTKRPPKTIKERKWAKRTIETGDGTEAAVQVYDVSSRDSARAIASQNFSKLSLVPLMENMGITDDRLMEVLNEGLNATKTVSARVIVQKGSPTSQANGELPPADSRTDDFIEVPDYDVKHKYLKTALELKGHLTERGANTNVSVNIQNNTLNVDPQELEEFVQWQHERRRKALAEPAPSRTG